MFRIHQSQNLTKRLEPIALKALRVMEKLTAPAPVSAHTAMKPTKRESAAERRRRERRRTPLANGVSLKSTWY